MMTYHFNLMGAFCPLFLIYIMEIKEFQQMQIQALQKAYLEAKNNLTMLEGENRELKRKLRQYENSKG